MQRRGSTSIRARGLTRKYEVTSGLLLLAAMIAFLRWEAGLALAAVVTLANLRAPETPRYIEEAPALEGDT